MDERHNGLAIVRGGLKMLSADLFATRCCVELARWSRDSANGNDCTELLVRQISSAMRVLNQDVVGRLMALGGAPHARLADLVAQASIHARFESGDVLADDMRSCAANLAFVAVVAQSEGDGETEAMLAGKDHLLVTWASCLACAFEGRCRRQRRCQCPGGAWDSFLNTSVM